jgi:hypothetical protein
VKTLVAAAVAVAVLALAVCAAMLLFAASATAMTPKDVDRVARARRLRAVIGERSCPVRQSRVGVSFRTQVGRRVSTRSDDRAPYAGFRAEADEPVPGGRDRARRVVLDAAPLDPPRRPFPAR